MGFPFRGPAPATEDQVGILGTLLDWKARLETGLVAPQAILAATKAIPGILRLATDAESLAGVMDAAAITPAQAANARIAPQFTTLSAMAAVLPTGSLVVVPQVDYAGVGSVPAGTVYRSLWHIDSGKAKPLLPLRVSSLNFLNSSNFTNNVVKANVVLEPFETRALIQRTTAPLAYDEYLWIGATTGFLLWRGLFTVGIYSPRYQQDSRDTKAWVDGEQVGFEIAVNNLAGITPAQYDQIASFPVNFRPASDVFHGGSVYPFGTYAWNPATYYSQSTGFHGLLSQPPAGGTGVAANILGSSGSFKRVIPSV